MSIPVPQHSKMETGPEAHLKLLCPKHRRWLGWQTSLPRAQRSMGTVNPGVGHFSSEGPALDVLTYLKPSAIGWWSSDLSTPEKASAVRAISTPSLSEGGFRRDTLFLLFTSRGACTQLGLLFSNSPKGMHSGMSPPVSCRPETSRQQF